MAALLLNDLGFLLKSSIFYSLSVSLHIAFLAVLSVIWLCRRCKDDERVNDKLEHNNFLHHKLTFYTSLALALFYFLFSVSSSWSNLDFMFELDLGVRSIFWFLFACYVQFEFGRLREKEFPVLFRVLFGLFQFISLYSLVRHLLLLHKHAIIGAQLWVFDSRSILMGLLLNYAGFFGKQTGSEPDLLLQEPLLNESITSRNGSLYDNASFFSYLTFSWLGPLLSLGYKKTLNFDDIPVIGERDSINCVLPIFKTKLDQQTGVNGEITALKLTKAIFLTCLREIIMIAFYEIVGNLSSYVGPYLIGSFVTYLYGTTRSNKQGYMLVFAFIIAKVFQCLSKAHYTFQLQQVKVRLRAALVGVIYQKGLTLSSQSRQIRTTGEIVNIMSVDVSQVSGFASYIHKVWMLPIQVGLALTILCLNLGSASLFALVPTFLFMMLNIPFSGMQQNFVQHMMMAKDTRMKATSEVLCNMHTLKLQGWEMNFFQKICDLRNIEASWIKKLYYVIAGIMVFTTGMPTFIAIVTFGMCMIIGIPLSTGKVLSALATFRLLHGPIYSLPETISSLIEIKVSLDRISSFLCLEDLPNDAVHRAPKESSETAVELQNCTFSWDPKSDIPTLKDLNFKALHGMRIAVCGTVGSGKSSLLSCILGEMPKLSGAVKLCGSTAYVSQSPWIQNGNIEDNILFGTEMNRDRYDMVLKVCSLNKDLKILPHGDQTVIGERGINLSGGQKQRIQIARAIYQDADIYLFDDPFSALDAHTGSHVFKKCLMGFLASKTVIYVTHQVEFLPVADLILVMKEGKISISGKYKEILEYSTDFMDLVGAHKDALSAIDAISFKELDASSSPEELDASISLEEPEASSSSQKAQEESPKGQLVQEEEREEGKVGFLVFWKYLTTAYKGGLVLLVLLAQISFQVLQIASNYWMTSATPVSEGVAPPVSAMRLITVFVALSIGCTLCILMMALLLATAGYTTANILFEKMHASIFRAPMSFFDSTPSGRILNRAAADQSGVDLSLPLDLGTYSFTVIQVLGTIAVMSQVAWQVFVVFIPVTALCIWYQRYYIETARELARLVGVYRAPVIQQFAESLTGSTTIRSFGKELDFINRNGRLVDDSSRPNFYRAAAMEWLSLRIEVLSSFIFAMCLVFLVTIPAGFIDPGFSGLCVAYGLDLNMLLSGTIWLFCSLEIAIISVERILQYTNIPSEPPLYTPEDLALDNSWPRQGEIKLENLQLRYAPQLPFVLRGLSCTFPGGLKTGIVGRTGSGKSTLIQALFRIVDPTVGQILIDHVDICTVGLHDLRSRLSIIPQDPTMFQGTIRNNLDPLEEYTMLRFGRYVNSFEFEVPTDEEKGDEQYQYILALDCCQLGDEVRKKDLKLDTPVTQNGENWSMGQRQLVCLGRVILKKSKILVLDEATASVDTATDSLIQKTLRQNFSDSTVIMIAHRITSVLDSDVILLLDNGIAVENDTPSKLLEDKSSLFSQLVLEYTTRSA